jgi:hypothetical protein
MGDLERAGMVSAQAGQRRRIAQGLCSDLRRRRHSGRDRQRRTVEKIASGYAAHGAALRRANECRTLHGHASISQLSVENPMSYPRSPITPNEARD